MCSLDSMMANSSTNMEMQLYTFSKHLMGGEAVIVVEGVHPLGPCRKKKH